MNNLKSESLKGFGWSFFERIVGYAIQFVFTILLARMLTPEDFGLVGLLIVFTSISQVFIESGFSQTLIRKRDTDNNIDYSAVFYFNLLTSIIIYFILFVLSKKIAAFYQEERLVLICQISFLSLIINSLSIVPNIILQKEMNFEVLSKRTLISNLIAGIISVGFAYAGFGVWSLVLQILIANILKLVLIWYYIDWHPLRKIDLNPIKNLYKFSLNILFSSLLDTIVSNLHILIIGKFYPKRDLGFYSQSYTLQSIPSNALVSVIRSVTYPAMSKIQNDEILLRNYFLKIQSISFYIIFSLFVLLSIISNEIIRIVLGLQWIDSIYYFKMLCFVGAFMPIYNLGMNVILVKGNGKKYLITSIYKRLITTSLVLMTISISIKFLIYGQILAVILNSLVTILVSGNLLGISLKYQLSTLSKTILIALSIYGLMIFGNDYLPQDNLYFSLLIKLTIFLSLFIALSVALKVKEYYIIKDLLLRRN